MKRSSSLNFVQLLVLNPLYSLNWRQRNLRCLDNWRQQPNSQYLRSQAELGRRRNQKKQFLHQLCISVRQNTWSNIWRYFDSSWAQKSFLAFQYTRYSVTDSDASDEYLDSGNWKVYKWVLCVTVVHIANIKMINETVPVQLLGACGTVVNFMMSVGYYLVLGLGCLFACWRL